MNRMFRFVIAGVLALVLIVGAASVWAGSNQQGTVPLLPIVGGGPAASAAQGCTTIDMITALFNSSVPNDGSKYVCTATKITTPTPEEYGPAPEGTVFYGDIFKVVVTKDEAEVLEIPTNVCYAYPPEFEEKEANVYVWNIDNSNEWEEIPDPNISGDPKLICVTSPTTGIFALIGNP
ncbi:MAG TPA: hypothetical protein PLQ94_08030 [Anaerolineales bacterium]|nr:hypothetical protein [Anaerolineales bacterium]